MSVGPNAAFSATGIVSGSKSVGLGDYTHPVSTEKGYGAGWGLGVSIYWVFKK